MKRSFNLQGLFSLHVQENHGALLFYGNEKSLPYSESVASIEDGARLRPNRKRSCKPLRREHLAVGMELQVKFPENLERIDPSFHAASFVSKQASAHSSCRQKFPRTRGARQFHRRTRFRRFLAIQDCRPSRRNQRGDKVCPAHSQGHVIKWLCGMRKFESRVAH